MCKDILDKIEKNFTNPIIACFDMVIRLYPANQAHQLAELVAYPLWYVCMCVSMCVALYVTCVPHTVL